MIENSGLSFRALTTRITRPVTISSNVWNNSDFRVLSGHFFDNKGSKKSIPVLQIPLKNYSQSIEKTIIGNTTINYLPLVSKWVRHKDDVYKLHVDKLRSVTRSVTRLVLFVPVVFGMAVSSETIRYIVSQTQVLLLSFMNVSYIIYVHDKTNCI